MYSNYTKKLLIMSRNSFLAIFFVCLCGTMIFANDGKSQSSSLNDISVVMEKDMTSLKGVFESIEKQTGFEFSYFKSTIKNDRLNLILGKKENLGILLNKISESSKLSFKRVNDKIYVSKYGKKTGAVSEQVQVLDVDISGKVTDENGEGLPGASVVVKGTNLGTTTNLDGNYKLSLSEGEVIVISFVGYMTQEIEIGSRSEINVQMNPDSRQLEELVVVGYGLQKKANLTGAVTNVAGTDLMKRPTPNVENLLQGKVAGLQVTQGGGTPGDDGAQLRIRGLGTFSSVGSSPLVLIDGVLANMSDLDPNNIESVSVLKDAASAAIYGARAANGVILITTKKGKNQPVSVEYHVNFQAQKATSLPDLVTNSADYMELWNEANTRAGLAQYFPQADIDAYRNNPNDPVNYPNYDWADHLYSTAIAQNHNITVSGGTENTTYNLSVGYLDQPGILPLFDFKRYNFLLSLETKINDWITVGANVQGVKKDKVRDIQSGFNEAYFVMHTFAPGPNYTPTMTLPDGSTGYVARYSNNIAEWTVRNPYAMLAAGSRISQSNSTRSQIYSNVNLTKNLTWSTKAAANIDQGFIKNHEHAVDNYYFNDGSYAHNNGVWHLGVIDDMNTYLLTTLYSTLNYNKVFNSDHTVSVLGGYNQESAQNRSLGGSRRLFPTDNLVELNAGAADGQSTRGTASEWAIQSFFGRLSYDYKAKYLFEANVRYDGTSRIAPDTRWGLFPSLSAGWRISEESFMENVSWLDNLKFRGSWGKLGNQNVGTYPYQNVLSNSSYPFGSNLEAGVNLNRLVDQSLQWETTTITDFGLDASVKNGLFTFTVDWYNKITDGILYQVPVPASVGLSSPTVNGGKMKNTGWDFELGHNNKIGELSFNVSLNLSTYKNEVLSILSPTLGTYTVQEGLPYNSLYMVEWIGIFQTQAEIDEGPLHPYNPKPGDLKFKDQNNDGVINSEDRKVIDGAFPDFYYGGSINVSWRNFDVSAFFQGVQGVKNYVINWGLTPFVQGAAPTQELADNRWTGPGSTNEYPAIYRAGYNPVMGTTSTFLLQDASYLRLKNLRIGYNIPTEIVEKIGLKNAQVYFSGDNLLTFTKYPGLDPERIGGGAFSVFPQLKTLAFGLKVKL